MLLMSAVANQRQGATHSDLFGLSPAMHRSAPFLLDQRPWVLVVPAIIFSSFSTDLFRSTMLPRLPSLLQSKCIGQTQQQPFRTFILSSRYVLATNKTQCYGLESFAFSPHPRVWRNHSSTLASKSRTTHYHISPPSTIPLPDPTTLVTVPQRCMTADFLSLECTI
jgi:hypothetical protein